MVPRSSRPVTGVVEDRFTIAVVSTESMPKLVSPDDAVTTYRYVRLGLVALVIFLIASVITTHRHAEGWQNWIGAYFYTSSHSVFIASLCAVGVCLIIYQGSTMTEDSLLNFAGFLAFIVGRFRPRGKSCAAQGCPTILSNGVRREQRVATAHREHRRRRGLLGHPPHTQPAGHSSASSVAHSERRFAEWRAAAVTLSNCRHRANSSKSATTGCPASARGPNDAAVPAVSGGTPGGGVCRRPAVEAR